MCRPLGNHSAPPIAMRLSEWISPLTTQTAFVRVERYATVARGSIGRETTLTKKPVQDENKCIYLCKHVQAKWCSVQVECEILMIRLLACKCELLLIGVCMFMCHTTTLSLRKSIASGYTPLPLSDEKLTTLWTLSKWWLAVCVCACACVRLCAPCTCECLRVRK